MEALLDSTVEQVSRPNPGFFLAGSPSCRGYLLKGYGFVFVLPARWLPVRSAAAQRPRRPAPRGHDHREHDRDLRRPPRSGPARLDARCKPSSKRPNGSSAEAERAFEEMTREIRARLAAAQAAWGDVPPSAAARPRARARPGARRQRRPPPSRPPEPCRPRSRPTPAKPPRPPTRPSFPLPPRRAPWPPAPWRFWAERRTRGPGGQGPRAPRGRRARRGDRGPRGPRPEPLQPSARGDDQRRRGLRGRRPVPRRRARGPLAP